MSSPRSKPEPTIPRGGGVHMYMREAPASTPGVLDIHFSAVFMVLPTKVIFLAGLRSHLGLIRKLAWRSLRMTAAAATFTAFRDRV